MTEQQDESRQTPGRKPLSAWGKLARFILFLIGGFVLFVLLVLGTCFLR